jgi:hypothetical protein
MQDWRSSTADVDRASVVVAAPPAVAKTITVPRGSKEKIHSTLKTNWWETKVWQPRVSASDAADMVREGDIILFSGTAVTERCLQCGLRTVYHHTAIIVQLDWQLMVVESNVEGVSSFPAGAYFDACNWKFMKDRFGTVAIRRLVMDGKPGLDVRKRQALRKFATEMIGKKYATPDKMILSFMGVGQKHDLSRVYCSELVAAAYQQIGILDDSRAPADFLPSDFALEGQTGWVMRSHTRRKLRLKNHAALTSKSAHAPRDRATVPRSLARTTGLHSSAAPTGLHSSAAPTGLHSSAALTRFPRLVCG